MAPSIQAKILTELTRQAPGEKDPGARIIAAVNAFADAGAPLRKKFSFVGFKGLLLLMREKPALQSLRRALEPGGLLLIDTFIPWDLIDGPPSRTSIRSVRSG